MNPYSKASVAQRLGLPNLSNVAQANNSLWAITFAIAPLATTLTRTVSKDNPNGGVFVVTHITGVLHNGAGAAVADSELVTLDFSMNGAPWNDGPIAWDSVVGTAMQPFIFPFQPVIQQTGKMSILVTNGSAGTIAGSITMWGVVSRT